MSSPQRLLAENGRAAALVRRQRRLPLLTAPPPAASVSPELPRVALTVSHAAYGPQACIGAAPVPLGKVPRNPHPPTPPSSSGSGPRSGSRLFAASLKSKPRLPEFALRARKIHGYPRRRNLGHPQVPDRQLGGSRLSDVGSGASVGDGTRASSARQRPSRRDV